MYMYCMIFICMDISRFLDYYRMGKTTLLRHIAERKLAIPAGIDVLYCEQGCHLLADLRLQLLYTRCLCRGPIR